MGSKKTRGPIKPNFLVVGVHDIITPFKFGDDRFRGFGLAKGQSLPFPIYFEGRPYNTHTIVWGVMYCEPPSLLSPRSAEGAAIIGLQFFTGGNI